MAKKSKKLSPEQTAEQATLARMAFEASEIADPNKAGILLDALLSAGFDTQAPLFVDTYHGSPGVKSLPYLHALGAHPEARPGIIGALAQRGVDLNARDRTGSSPFLRAAFRGNIPIAQALMEHGADPFAPEPFAGFDQPLEASNGAQAICNFLAFQPRPGAEDFLAALGARVQALSGEALEENGGALLLAASSISRSATARAIKQLKERGFQGLSRLPAMDETGRRMGEAHPLLGALNWVSSSTQAAIPEIGMGTALAIMAFQESPKRGASAYGLALEAMRPGSFASAKEDPRGGLMASLCGAMLAASDPSADLNALAREEPTRKTALGEAWPRILYAALGNAIAEPFERARFGITHTFSFERQALSAPEALGFCAGLGNPFALTLTERLLSALEQAAPARAQKIARSIGEGFARCASALLPEAFEFSGGSWEGDHPRRPIEPWLARVERVSGSSLNLGPSLREGLDEQLRAYKRPVPRMDGGESFGNGHISDLALFDAIQARRAQAPPESVKLLDEAAHRLLKTLARTPFSSIDEEIGSKAGQGAFLGAFFARCSTQAPRQSPEQKLELAKILRETRNAGSDPEWREALRSLGDSLELSASLGEGAPIKKPKLRI